VRGGDRWGGLGRGDDEEFQFARADAFVDVGGADGGFGGAGGGSGQCEEGDGEKGEGEAGEFGRHWVGGRKRKAAW
jgi:hypothetical protein